MIALINSLPFLAGGIIAVTLLSTLGAYASKKLKFRFVYLSFFSILLYILLGAYLSETQGLSIAIMVNLMIGFWDATIGWKLVKKIRPETGLTDEQLQKMSTSTNLTIMLFVTIFFTFIGYGIS